MEQVKNPYASPLYKKYRKSLKRRKHLRMKRFLETEEDLLEEPKPRKTKPAPKAKNYTGYAPHLVFGAYDLPTSTR